jgi:ATP-dependent DNA helicase RecG
LRPAILNPLFTQVEKLPGIGPRYAALITRLCGPNVRDLLWHLPISGLNRQLMDSARGIESGQIVTLHLTIESHEPPARRGQPYRIQTWHKGGRIELAYFNQKGDYLNRLLPIGGERLVSGRLEWRHGMGQMIHPDYVVDPTLGETIPSFEPIYGLTTGLPSKIVQKAVTAALDRLPVISEWLDESLLKREYWPGFAAAMRILHHPASVADIAPDHPARRRLAYDELLANQLALALVRARQKKARGRVLQGDGRFQKAILATLPYQLTHAQTTALKEIAEDLISPTKMLRLLQGDVGSGKTIVAVMAMAMAAEAGAQSALMAPTDILARQHRETLTPLAMAAGLRLGLLTGRDSAKERRQTLELLANGDIDIVIGTHALFQEQVVFRDLGLVIIDEQHRFGVHQRLALSQKGQTPDVLVMTATPIPRTLTLTAYGDMDVSRLMEKPPGRRPIETRTIPREKMDDLVHGLERAITGGARVYWVCPLVEESEDLEDIADATTRFEGLKNRFPDRVGLVHGRMKGPEKDQTIADFAAGKLDILVATTVIEVGVNVPEATIMVIEHAERFGLAQLHQLRGRVGRGGAQSSCILLYDGPLSEVARERLKILRESEDGFRIAEVDLALRGAGEMLGTRQSGLPEFRLAVLERDHDLMVMAHDEAKLILNRDEELLSPRGQLLRVLLYLFERDVAVRYLRSG